MTFASLVRRNISYKVPIKLPTWESKLEADDPHIIGAM